MRRLGIRSLALAALLPLAGCVYYNAMYNARRLAGAAEKAEREGRTIDAGNYWAQVIVKADTLVARHPESEWVDDALVLRGQALAHSGQCTEARPMLEQLLPTLAKPELVERASFALGRCRLALGAPAGALPLLARVTEGQDERRRAEARFLYARALRLSGRAGEAADVLATLRDERAPAERMVALADAGRSAEALALADTFIARLDSLAPWDSTLTALGRRDPPAASTLIDRLRPLSFAQPHVGRWLLDDGVRLAAASRERGAARVGEAVVFDSTATAAARGRFVLARWRLAQATTPAELAPVAETLRGLAVSGAVDSAASFVRAADAVRAADSIPPGAPRGDLRVFLAAEAARDTLRSTPIAAGLFRRVVDGWPDSPYAPKALLAARALDPAYASATDTLLAVRYATSPYLTVLRGLDDSAYRALEDSLGAFATSLASSTNGEVAPTLRPKRDPTDSTEVVRPRRPGGRARTTDGARPRPEL